MKLKLDDKGLPVIQDGKPVYIMDDGKEVAFDAPHSVATISRLNAESKGHRERAEKAEGVAKVFEGLDADAAREALKTIKNLSDKKLVDAGDVERVKLEAIKATEQKYAPIVQERDKLQAALNDEMIGGRFSRSKFIGEKLVIPADIAQARFSKNFKIEDGRVVAIDASGNPLYSRARPGEKAEFEEALEMIVDGYSQKDAILKAKSKGGSGAPASGGNNGDGGKKSITRKDFESLDPASRSSKIREGFAVVDGA